jgi:hypothetical protein
MGPLVPFSDDEIAAVRRLLEQIARDEADQVLLASILGV